MALNQNAHRRNLEALEYIKQQREKQKKYNLTPGKAVKYAKTANNYANKFGSTLSELGEDTNNATIKNIGNKIYNNTGSNLGNKVYDFAKDKIATFKNGADIASKASSMANTANNASNVANTASNVSNVANNASNVANTANTASNVANAASTASNASGAASSAGSSAGGGAPVVGTALGGISAVNNFSKGDNVNGALDVAKTGAAFIPVYGQIAAAVISAIQMARNAFLKKKQEAHSKTQDAAAKATEESMLSANEKKQEIAQDRAEKQQELFADNPINGQFGDGGVAMPEKLPTFSDMASEIVPKNEGGEPQTISGQIQEALPKDTITQGIMDKVKGLFGQNQEEGQMTGGSAGLLSPNFDNQELDRMIQNEKLKTDKQEQINANPQLEKDIKENSIVNFPTQTLTPEQQARYDEAQAIQAQGNQQIINNIMSKANLQRPQSLEGGSSTEALPPLPTASPTASPSRTNFNPNQFDIINPDGTIIPASQQAQRPVIQGQVSTTQPAQPQQQVIPYEENQSKVADIMRRIRQGWDENTTERFSPTNITDKTYDALVQDKDGNISKQEIAKNIWNRLGEGVGTGQKLLSNPLMQGLIAGAIYKATGGDGGESLKYGVDWAQNKAKSDYYQKQINPSAKPNILGGYTAEDWKTKESIENAKAQQQYSQALLEERRRENDIRIQKMISDMQKGSNATQNTSFNETLNGILSNQNISSERKIEALSKLLREFSTLGKEQLAYAKNFADLYGIDLGLGN